MYLHRRTCGSLSRRQFLRGAALGIGGAALVPSPNHSAIAETTGDRVQIPNVEQPGYLESYVDPVFQSTVTRITGNPGTNIPNVRGKWARVERHFYSKSAAWNCDQSMLLIGARRGHPGLLFLDGNTYEPLFGRDAFSGSDIRWHPNEPSTMICVKDNSVRIWDVRKDKTRIAATFDGYSNLHIGPGEGNLSFDGNLIALVGNRGRDRITFAYHLHEEKKWRDLVLNGVEIDWVSVSPSGKYMVLNGGITAKDADQSQVYDLEGISVGESWSAYGRPSHYDLTLDEHGDDIAVGVSKSPPDSGRVITRRLRDGMVTMLTTGGYASHISTRNVARPGWAYVTYQNRAPDWPPYWDEVVAVKLDGSMTVERIAHLHTRLSDYLTEAHAVASPDGTRVLWASNWESPSGRPIAAYVAHVRKSREHD